MLPLTLPRRETDPALPDLVLIATSTRTERQITLTH
jgi:hypothetical protein